MYELEPDSLKLEDTAELSLGWVRVRVMVRVLYVCVGAPSVPSFEYDSILC